MAKGHVTIDGKNYLVVDESYSSKPLPLYRPQLVVQGISHEALDQYQYMVQDTWNKRTWKKRRQAWSLGMFDAAQGVDGSEDGYLRLQAATSVVDSWTGTKKSLLVSIDGTLYCIRSDGTVRKTTDGTTWSAQTYDAATYGNIISIYPIDTGGSKAIAGTDTGRFISLGTTFNILSVTAAISGVKVTAVGAFNGRSFEGRDNGWIVAWGINDAGVFGPALAARRVSGVPRSFVPWSQTLMVGITTGGDSSLIASTTDGVTFIDTYPILGAFAISTLATWGSFFFYGGSRSTEASEFYLFRENLVEQITRTNGGIGVVAILPTAKYLLFGHNETGGLWWATEEGIGPFCEYTAGATGADRIVRSAVLYKGNVYYTIDNVGVIKAAVSPTSYAMSGSLSSGYFDGGFPTLTKDWGDIELRLQSALITGQTFSVKVRKEGESTFTSVGSLSVGDQIKVLDLPSTHRQSRMLDVQVLIGGPGTSSPELRSAILRYKLTAPSKRVWGFTVKAAQDLEFLDGTKETRSPQSIITDLFALKSAGRVSFSTVLEPTARTVYITDVTLKSQLLGRVPQHAEEQEEGYVAVEVLEA